MPLCPAPFVSLQVMTVFVIVARSLCRRWAGTLRHSSQWPKSEGLWEISIQIRADISYGRGAAVRSDTALGRWWAVPLTPHSFGQGGECGLTLVKTDRYHTLAGQVQASVGLWIAMARQHPTAGQIPAITVTAHGPKATP